MFGGFGDNKTVDHFEYRMKTADMGTDWISVDKQVCMLIFVFLYVYMYYMYICLKLKTGKLIDMIKQMKPQCSKNNIIIGFKG